MVTTKESTSTAEKQSLSVLEAAATRNDNGIEGTATNPAASSRATSTASDATIATASTGNDMVKKKVLGSNRAAVSTQTGATVGGSQAGVAAPLFVGLGQSSGKVSREGSSRAGASTQAGAIAVGGSHSSSGSTPRIRAGVAAPLVVGLSQSLAKKLQNSDTGARAGEDLRSAQTEAAARLESKMAAAPGVDTLPHTEKKCATKTVDDFDVLDVVQMRSRMGNEEVDRANPAIADQNPRNTQTPAPALPPLTSLAATTQPGAYGNGLHRRNDFSSSHLGIQTNDDQANEPSNNNHGDGGLAEALPVEDDELPPDMEAQPYDIEEAQKRKLVRDEKQRKVFLLLAFVLAFIVLGVILGVFFGRSNNTQEDLATTPTLRPSLAPSSSPSSAPSGTLDVLRLGLPDYTLVSLETFGTPQWKAWEWMSNHPKVAGMDAGKQKQLLALATFYFSMGGPHWPEVIRDGWLQYDIDECYWFSSEFGFFSGFFGAYSRYDQSNTNPCNDNGEFQLLYLNQLELTNHTTPVSIPPELAFLTSLSILGLPQNGIQGKLDDFLPSQFYQMTNLTYVFLYANGFTGTLPSQVGLLSTLGELEIHVNSMTGVLPSELGLMTSLDDLAVNINSFSGQIPSQLGLMTSMTELYLYGNELSGKIPSELGLMTAMTELYIGWYGFGNSLTGPIPSEMGLMSNTAELGLVENSFTGFIPEELANLAVQGPLEMLLFDGSELSGVVPEGLCSIGYFTTDYYVGLNFDCNSQLCGCCWCPCLGNDTTLNNTDCSVPPAAFVPSSDDKEWPGNFPTPINSTNVVTINVRTDNHPEETSWEWSQLKYNNNNTQEEDTGSAYWSLMKTQAAFEDANSVTSSTLQVVSGTLCKLSLFDIREGICCRKGLGWFTITNSIPYDDNSGGSVLWEAKGDALGSSALDVYIWVDLDGIAQSVEYVPGQGYGVTNKTADGKESLLQVVVPDIPISTGH